MIPEQASFVNAAVLPTPMAAWGKRIGFSDAFKREGNGLLIPSFHGIASESFPCIF